MPSPFAGQTTSQRKPSACSERITVEASNGLGVVPRVPGDNQVEAISRPSALCTAKAG